MPRLAEAAAVLVYRVLLPGAGNVQPEGRVRPVKSIPVNITRLTKLA